MIGSSANVMIVPNARPWKTIQDFIADAKAKPGSISFGSVGIGSAVHISTEKFRFAAGIEATHVPYRAGPEVIADIIGGGGGPRFFPPPPPPSLFPPRPSP